MPDDLSSTYAYSYGITATNVTSSTSAYTRGIYIWSSLLHAFLRGGYPITTSQDAFLYGGVADKSSTEVFLGVTGGLKRGQTSCYTSGVVRGSVEAYTEGHVAEYDHIWLQTSDGGATMSKKFRVLAQGYDDGTPEKAETLERTIGGGLNLNVGAIYKTWSPIIRVRHTESVTDYGTMAELEAFYALNNPNGTPSNKITFIDHHGTSRTVYIIGQLKKAIMGFKTEGEYAWFTIAIRMIEVQ